MGTCKEYYASRLQTSAIVNCTTSNERLLFVQSNRLQSCFSSSFKQRTMMRVVGNLVVDKLPYFSTISFNPLANCWELYSRSDKLSNQLYLETMPKLFPMDQATHADS